MIGSKGESAEKISIVRANATRWKMKQVKDCVNEDSSNRGPFFTMPKYAGKKRVHFIALTDPRNIEVKMTAQIKLRSTWGRLINQASLKLRPFMKKVIDIESIVHTHLKEKPQALSRK